ncbi:MAG: 30S ribosomal protein S8e, partial [Candidatus Woesearchaeota archaeon]
MAVSQFKSKQKQTGAKYKDFRKKRKSDMGRPPTHTKIGEKKIKSIRTAGNNRKVRVLLSDTVNVYDIKEKKSFPAKIKTVAENPAN